MIYFLAAIFCLGIFAYVGALLVLITPRKTLEEVRHGGHDEHDHGHGHDDHHH